MWSVSRAREQRVRKAQSSQGWLPAEWRALQKREGGDRTECLTLGGLAAFLPTYLELW